MSRKYHVQRREFLSFLPDWGAYVIAVVEAARDRHVQRPDSGDYGEYQEINLRISDGSKEIALYFGLDTLEDRSNTLEMISRLADVIGEFKKAVEAEIEVLSARQPIPKHERVSSAVH